MNYKHYRDEPETMLSFRVLPVEFERGHEAVDLAEFAR